MTIRAALRAVGVAAGAMLLCAAAPPVSAAADSGRAGASEPARPGIAGGAAFLVAEHDEPSGVVRMEVYSPAMGRVVPVLVVPPTDSDAEARAGVFYLLDGNSGRTDHTNWLDPAKGDAREFFAGKNVYAVFPVGGTGTLYSDWRSEHPELGTVAWETFLTRELPAVIDARFDTDGRAAIGGISSGAEGAVMLAARHPGMYAAVAGYSGCYTTEGPMGAILTDVIVAQGGAENMWGPYGDEDWREHDIFRNAGNLRGTTVYLSSGSGLPGPYERPGTPWLAQRVVTGGLLEAGSNVCTDQLVPALRAAGVDVVRSARPVGEHDWPYWRDELARSWPVVKRALG